jgi:hypothetical protein
MNLARAYAVLDRLVDARAEVARALEEPDGPEITDAATDLMRELQERTPTVSGTMAGESFGVELRVDDDTVPLGTDWPVDPGVHQVSILRGGEEIEGRTLAFAPGDHRHVEFRVAEPAVVSTSFSRIPPARTHQVDPVTEIDHDPENDQGTLLESPWFWVGFSAILAAVAITYVATLEPAPISGDFDPGTIDLNLP